MAIRKGLMSDESAAADASDVGWGSSDADGWPIANLGLDLGSAGLNSDTPPPRIGDSQPNDVEDPPPGRSVDVPAPEPDPSLDRPLLGSSDLPSGNSDGPPASPGGLPADRIVDVPSSEPAGVSDRSVPGLSDPPPADANNRPMADAGPTADSTHAPPDKAAALASLAELVYNTIYFRPDASPGNSDESPQSRDADARVDPAACDHRQADPDPRDVWTPPAGSSDDPSQQVMLAGAWHL